MESLFAYGQENTIEGWRDWTYSKHAASAQVKDFMANLQAGTP